MKKLIVIAAIASGLFIASCGNQNGSEPTGAAPAGTQGADGTDNVINDANQVGNQTGSMPPANDSFVNSIPSGKAYDANGSRGSALIATHNCKTCHMLNEKNIGPSYKMVAEKYSFSEAMVDELSLKIRNGGSGRWGTVVMPPHQNISVEDSREMARFILSLSTDDARSGVK